MTNTTAMRSFPAVLSVTTASAVDVLLESKRSETMSIANHKTAGVVAALMLACASAASAADFHPEDSACRLPCEVHDASAKAAPTAPGPTRVPPAASEGLRKRDKRTPHLASTTNRSADDSPAAALARQRVAH
jgi:hypothetical protein